MNLPKNEKTFYFQEQGETTYKNYEGQFNVKCALSMADKHALEIEQTRLTLDLQNPSPDLLAISRVVANLKIRVIDGPSWFKDVISNLDILDANIIFDIYGKCLESADEWHKEVKELANPKKEGDEGNLKES